MDFIRLCRDLEERDIIGNCPWEREWPPPPVLLIPQPGTETAGGEDVFFIRTPRYSRLSAEEAGKHVARGATYVPLEVVPTLTKGTRVAYSPRPGAEELGSVIQVNHDGGYPVSAFVLYDGDKTPKHTGVSDLRVIDETKEESSERTEA